jgi:hypothetical protein
MIGVLSSSARVRLRPPPAPATRLLIGHAHAGFHQPVDHRAVLVVVEVLVDRFRDDRADVVDRLDLLLRGFTQGVHRAEVDRECLRCLGANVADAERDEQTAQRLLLACLDVGEEPVEALVAEAIEFEQLLAPVGQGVEVG